MAVINEKHLLKLVSTGDEQAFRQIFDAYRDKLYSYVLRLTNSEEIAEEIVMDAFLKIWTNRQELDGIEQFDSYLYTVVRNRSFNAIKRIARENVIFNEASKLQEEYSECTEDSVVYNDYKAILNRTINRLPPQQKRIYILKDDGLRYEEIALALNLSKNTVKAHLKKAVSNVRTAFSYYLMFNIFLGLHSFFA